MASRWRKIAAAVLAAAGLAITIWQLNGYYPVRDWLFWIYARVWIAVGAWALACLAGGHGILSRFPSLVLPLRERVLFSFACGVLAFTVGLFLIGLAHGLGPVAFFAWPAALAASGALPLWRTGRRVRSLLRAARRWPTLSRPSAAGYVLFACGGLGVVALYLNVMTPNNIAYDSRWYHLGSAEHYAALHAITRFPEGWFEGSLPQLATYLYTWAFLLPGANLSVRIELAAHIEFVLFLATLASIPLLVRWLLRGVRLPLSWTALFLFPGILIYDSTLSVAADHIVAFWAVPVVLAARRMWRSWSVADACLFGAMAAAATVTKYQALYMLVAIAAAMAVKTVVSAWRRRSLRAVAPAPAAAVGVLAVLSAIHWLKNLIWYGDPMYPMLAGVLRVRPWNPDADPNITLSPPDFKPQGTLGHKLWESAQAVVKFPFEVHDWDMFHRNWPTFGFLFTLMFPFALLLRGAERLRALVGATLVGVFVWYWTFHQDRYLQSIVPWMAAIVAAIVWKMWHAGTVTRLCILPLLALQVIWGGDHYAFPTHSMLGQQPMRLTMDLLASGFQGHVADRLHPPSTMYEAGKSLPKGARVLLHESHLRLGIGASAVSDSRGVNGAISYRRARSRRALWQQLRDFGVTHVMWPSSPVGLEAYADETVFYDFATTVVSSPQSYGGMIVGAMPDTPPPEAPFRPVALLGCYVAHRVPLPEVEKAIWTNSPEPTAAQIAELTKDVDFMLIESPCRQRFASVDLGAFKIATSRNGWDTWVRK